jgi:DNA-binding MarR family transcriptional regulator
MADTDGVDAILEQWHRERPDLDASPIGVIGRISRLSREIERRLEPGYAASGLEPGWYDVLATLRRAGPPYRLRPTDFAATLMLTTSGTTKRLDRLEAAGYVTREPDPGDRRGVLIALTPQGRRLVDTAAATHLANERRILSGLTAAEQRQLADLLRKLSVTLPPQEKTSRPAAGRLPLGARLGRVPQPHGQPAVTAHPLARGRRLADDQTLDRHRTRRQLDRIHMQAEPADHLHACAVEQTADVRHHHPGRRIRIRLQRFLIRPGPPLTQADVRPQRSPPGRGQALPGPRETDRLVIRFPAGRVGQDARGLVHRLPRPVGRRSYLCRSPRHQARLERGRSLLPRDADVIQRRVWQHPQYVIPRDQGGHRPPPRGDAHVDGMGATPISAGTPCGHGIGAARPAAG